MPVTAFRLPRRSLLLGASAAVATPGLLGLAGCASPMEIAQRTIARAQPDMGAVIAAFESLGPKPIESLSPAEARRQPTIADAVRRVQVQRGMPTTPLPMAEVRDLLIPGGPTPLQARLYVPARGAGPLPVVVYFHGGGWVIADLDTYDASARAIAAQSGAIVLSVHYRQAPENRFPAAHDDAVFGYNYAVTHAPEFGGDPRRVALAGESAGGNLAINVAIAVRDQHQPQPVAQVLIYPVAGTDMDVPSVRENRDAVPLNAAMLDWFLSFYARNPGDLGDPRLDVVGKADLRGLPPTTIILADIDPLRSGGEMLARKLQGAGVPTEMRLYPGVTHEFFGTGAVVQQAALAQAYAGERLRAAFAAPLPAVAPVAAGRRVRR
ncbi:alpha/beta hydrolase [Roseomonas sp. NAR14]|uniref:Alpha/beta hydrolase n=1 Tax=Roseomonas acroporae TaxID=2937791 RepID=A0A9X1Y5C8_9PROT|nr:alpha/beta hydrolase [Roseomonas acroporae]MCK8783753.1 alpha/beta hydrolase [Roseomonas acroporae]